MIVSRFHDFSSSYWQAVHQELSLWRRHGLTASVWVRDDDATDVTEALNQLERIARRFSIQIGLAVIPAKVEQALITHLEPRSEAFYPMCHGYMHTDHGTEGNPSEFGDDRPLAALAEEARLASAAFSTHFRRPPVFVPPYSSISPHLERRLTQFGFKRLSNIPTKTQRGLAKLHRSISRLPRLPRYLAMAVPNVDIHVDVIDWGANSAKSSHQVASELLGELRMRRKGYIPPHIPIGVLTHHLVHNGLIWQSFEELLENLAAEPAVRLCGAADVIDNPVAASAPEKD
jgi:peptidoglycan/xylan/chitin deacetylase (PgdA/CDA1 family)